MPKNFVLEVIAWKRGVQPDFYMCVIECVVVVGSYVCMFKFAESEAITFTPVATKTCRRWKQEKGW